MSSGFDPTPQPPRQPARLETIRAPQSDLHAFVRTLWRWKFLLILVALPLPFFAIKNRQPPARYFVAETILKVGPVEVDPANGVPTTQNPLLDAYEAAQLLESPETAKLAAQTLKLKPQGEQDLLGLLSAVQTSVNPDTSFVSIKATSEVDRTSVKIANAFARAVRVRRRTAANQALNNLIDSTKQQVKSTPSADDRRLLKAKVLALQASRRTRESGVVVLKPAIRGKLVVTSRNRSIPLAFVMGLLMGIAAALIAEQMDRRVRTADELERVAGVRLLAVVPSAAFTGHDDRWGYVTQAIELLRASIWSQNRLKELKVLIIVSGRQGDGKTTVSVALAKSIARAGRNVVLVDADMRHPQISSRLGIAREPGLSEVLRGHAALKDALVRVPDVGQPEGDKVAGSLTVLPAGNTVPNAAELLVSPEMARVQSSLEIVADLVLIDTPAALATSDALPLLEHADGALVIARLRRTRHITLKRLLQRIEDAHGHTIGVVATGAKGASGHERYSYRRYENRGLLQRIKDQFKSMRQF